MQDHSAPDRMLKHFRFEHLPPFLQEVSKPFGELARQMIEIMPMSAERTAMLRKLVEAKDCAVRAYLEAREERKAMGLEEANRPD